MANLNAGSVALVAAGGVFVWSGVKGTSVTMALRDLIAGQQPSSSTVNPLKDSSSPGASAGTTGPSGGNPVSSSAKTNQATGKLMAASYGWGSGQEWTALNNIVMSESGWDNNAQNPGSTAYGIFQFLDTTWATVGYHKTSDPVVQIAAGLAYIKQRYGDPVKAWAFHVANGYY